MWVTILIWICLQGLYQDVANYDISTLEMIIFFVAFLIDYANHCKLKDDMKEIKKKLERLEEK